MKTKQALSKSGKRIKRPKQRVVRQRFDDWWMDVIIIARLLGFKEKQRATIDKDAWKDSYYDEHFTAAEAWQCEYESA